MVEVRNGLKEDISKLFAMEVREKKRIGSNIFKRVSTRRGGTDMSSMRVPTVKQQKELSGKVSTFNMKKIIPFEELQNKSNKDQKMLLEFWRNQYKTVEILSELGIDKNKYYKLLNKLGIERNSRNQNIIYERTAMSEKELESYLEDKENLLDYELFRIITSEQQDVLLAEYLNRYTSVPKLVDAWKGSQAGTLYYIKSRAVKKVDTEKIVTEADKNENKVAIVDGVIQEYKKEKAIPIIEKKTETVSFAEELEPIQEEKPLVETHPVFTVQTEQMTKTIGQAVKETENTIVDEKGTHVVNVVMDNESSEQSFHFSLKGSYSKETILRRLSMLMEEIQEAEEKLTIDISIKG